MRARNLAQRDPAMAALMGIIPFQGSNPDFGVQGRNQRGANFNGEFGSDWGDDFGDDFGDEFGDDYGADFGAAAPARVSPNSPAGQAKLTAMWNKASQRSAVSNRRASILEPNKNSSIKVERYSFTIAQTIVLGTASTINMTGQPDTTIRPQRLTINAPTPMFATISEIRVANVAVTVGNGDEDAFNYSPLGQGMSLDMPTLSPANRATVRGNYGGYTPPGYVGASSQTLSASFKGPASIVA